MDNGRPNWREFTARALPHIAGAKKATPSANSCKLRFSQTQNPVERLAWRLSKRPTKKGNGAKTRRPVRNREVKAWRASREGPIEPERGYVGRAVGAVTPPKVFFQAEMKSLLNAKLNSLPKAHSSYGYFYGGGRGGDVIELDASPDLP